MRRAPRPWWSRVLRALALTYLASVALLYATQRRVVYHAPPPREVDARAGELVRGRSPEGRPVVALWREGAVGAPVVVYLHGNGMQLADCADVVDILHARGWGAMAVEYPGYGPLRAGAASEAALVDTARGALAMLRARGVTAARTVLLGQSLGTGVAMQVASPETARRVVLMTPFRSLVDVGAERFWWIPVRVLMRDRFDTMARAPGMTLPTLVIHGTDDEIVPYAHGVAVAHALPHATLVTVRGATHNSLWDEHLDATMRALTPFIDAR